MLETRPIWILVLVLNVCIFIWLIAIEEPVVLSVSTTSIHINNNYNHIKSVKEDDDNNNTNNKNNANSHLNSHHLPLDLIEKFQKNNEKSNSIARNVITTARFRKHNKFHATNLLISATLPHNDYDQLIDLLDYRDLMKQSPCTFNIKGVILIHSAPRNHEKRQIIRDSWGKLIQPNLSHNNNNHNDHDDALRLLFLLGAVNSLDLQEMLNFENAIYGDLIQGSFIDDYRNMTYKHVMAFKWFLYNCPNAQILIKVDDDVYVNTFQLIDYIKLSQKKLENKVGHGLRMNVTTVSNIMDSLTTTPKEAITFDQTPANINNNSNSINGSSPSVSASSLAQSALSSSSPSTTTMNKINEEFNAKFKLFHHPQNLLFCKPTMNSLVKRSYRSKWRVSYREYNERYYPTYCPGYAIIYSRDVVLRLYMEAQKAKYFWIDDVHITGILAKKANIPITTSSQYVLSMARYEQLMSHDINLDQHEFLFAWHSISPQQMYQLWLMQMSKYNMTKPIADDDLRRHLKHDFLHNHNSNISINTIILSSFS